LAHLVAASGGPVDRLDGTFASLDDLSAWLVPFCEERGRGLLSFDDAPARALAIGVVFTPPEPGEDFEADFVVGAMSEPVTAYIFEVLRRIDPSTYWALWPHRPPRSRISYLDDNELGLTVGGSWGPVRFMASYARPHRSPSWSEREPRPAPEYLRQDVTKLFSLGPVPEQARGASILAPLVSLPRTMPPVPRFADEAALLAAERDTVDADPVQISHLDTDPDDPETGAPLDTAAVTNLLTELGTTTHEGRRLTKRALLGEGDQFLIYDGAVILDTLVHRRRVHALVLTPHTSTPAEWDHLLARLQAALPHLHAQLTKPEGL